MKLFIWFNPYQINYGGSALYVVAESLPAARKVALAEGIRRPYGIGAEPATGWLSEKMLEAAPDVVRDLPCAELYEWSE